VQWQNVAVKTIQKNDSCLIKLNFDALIRENTAGLKHFSQLKCCPHHGKGANRPVPSFHSEDSLGRQHVISSESQVRTANPHSILLCEPLLIDFCDDHFSTPGWLGSVLKPFTIINMHKVLWTSSAVRRGMLA
jgi:hypothetical protein